MKRTCTKDIPSMLAHQLIRRPRMKICRCLKFSTTWCFLIPFQNVRLPQKKHQVPCCTDRIHRIKPNQNSEKSHWSGSWWLKPWWLKPHMNWATHGIPKHWTTHGITNLKCFRISTKATVHLFVPFGGDPSCTWSGSCGPRLVALILRHSQAQKSMLHLELRCGVFFFSPTSNI